MVSFKVYEIYYYDLLMCILSFKLKSCRERLKEVCYFVSDTSKYLHSVLVFHCSAYRGLHYLAQRVRERLGYIADEIKQYDIVGLQEVRIKCLMND